MFLRYANRTAAGERLADELDLTDGAVVLGLPRGGVAVAAPIARRFDAELGVLVVRKVGAPGHAELALGAVASGGVFVANRDVIRHLGVGPAVLDDLVELERRHLAAQEERFGAGIVDVEGRTVVLVDDGIATGATARSAIESLRLRDPGRVILAVPVAPPDALESFRSIADEVVCPQTPRRFGSVGRWYDDFSQVTDAEVTALLAG